MDKEIAAIKAAKILPAVGPRTVLGKVITQVEASAPIAVNFISKASTFAKKL